MGFTQPVMTHMVSFGNTSAFVVWEVGNFGSIVVSSGVQLLFQQVAVALLFLQNLYNRCRCN